MSKRETSVIKIDSLTILFIVFLVLKLTGHIDWSWWWVTAPIWGQYAVILVLGVASLVLLGFVLAVEWVCDRFF